MKATVDLPEELVAATLREYDDLDAAVVDALQVATEMENFEEMLE